MRNLFIFLAISFFLVSCTNKDQITSDSFKDVDGLLYYEKPETGSVVYAVFLPFAKNRTNFNLQELDSNDYENGIKFSTANSLIKDKLYLENHKKLILKGGIDRSVYLLTKARIHFHIEESTYSKNNVIENNIQGNTLVFMGKNIKFKYRFSWITLDSIRVD